MERKWVCFGGRGDWEKRMILIVYVSMYDADGDGDEGGDKEGGGKVN
jgi:hypothetical protein